MTWSAGFTRPVEAWQSLDDGGYRRRQLRRQIIGIVFMVLLGLFIAGLMSQATTTAEWGRAFGRDHRVSGIVAGVIPNVGSTRVCTLSRVVLVWAEDGNSRSGYLDVCSDETGKYRRGTTVAGWALRADPRDDPVGVNVEGRPSAIFGVTLESLMILGLVAVIAALCRTLWRLLRAPHVLSRRIVRSMTVDLTTHTFANGRSVRSGTRVVLHPEDGDNLSAVARTRRDTRLLAAGDALSVIPTGHSLFRHRPAGPVALIREADRQLFWSNALRPDKGTQR
ncbi:MAG TPA: hypothetical protein VHX59_11905 [Mycobacteriales bacterium]|nr:hypothetical protein [Mycobacteriales bacterium]